jgi:hypothetical protein
VGESLSAQRQAVVRDIQNRAKMTLGLQSAIRLDN